MKLGLIVYTDDTETVSNAFQFAIYAREAGDQVEVFLLGKGVGASLGKTGGYARNVYSVAQQMKTLVDSGGRILVSGQCLEFRELGVPDLCTRADVKAMHEMVKSSDRVITF